MRKNIVAIILILCSTTISAQEIKIEFNSGIGSYAMNGLKDLNAYYLKNLPVVAKITDDFPIQPFYSIGLIYQTNSIFSVGLTGSFVTTGSRISYKDYSGELVFDNVVKAYSPGIQFGFVLVDKKLHLSQETNISYAFTNLEMKEKIINQTDENVFKSNSIMLEPRFRVSYLINRFELGAKAGYLIDFGGKYYLDGKKDSFLQNPQSDNSLKNKWSGFRLGLFVGFAFD